MYIGILTQRKTTRQREWTQYHSKATTWRNLTHTENAEPRGQTPKRTDSPRPTKYWCTIFWLDDGAKVIRIINYMSPTVYCNRGFVVDDFARLQADVSVLSMCEARLSCHVWEVSCIKCIFNLTMIFHLSWVYQHITPSLSWGASVYTGKRPSCPLSFLKSGRPADS